MRFSEQLRAGYVGRIFLALLAAFACIGVPAAHAQRLIATTAAQPQPAATPPAQIPPPAQAETANVSQVPPQEIPPAVAAEDDKTSFSLEVGGFYNHLSSNYGTWRGADLKLAYTANKWISPAIAFSSQTRDSGTQQNFGTYSYVTLRKGMFAIVGVSGAPEKEAVLYPKLRTGGALFLEIPGLHGLFVSGGFDDFFMEDGGGGSIISTGATYYLGRLILSGGVNFNRSRPGGLHSKSGQAGFQFGSQGKYWLGAAVSGGKTAYQTLGFQPFDVRFDNIGVSASYQKWLTKHFGLIWRYDFQNQVDAFTRHGVSASAFFEF